MDRHTESMQSSVKQGTEKVEKAVDARSSALERLQHYIEKYEGRRIEAAKLGVVVGPTPTVYNIGTMPSWPPHTPLPPKVAPVVKKLKETFIKLEASHKTFLKATEEYLKCAAHTQLEMLHFNHMRVGVLASALKEVTLLLEKDTCHKANHIHKKLLPAVGAIDPEADALEYAATNELKHDSQVWQQSKTVTGLMNTMQNVDRGPPIVPPTAKYVLYRCI